MKLNLVQIVYILILINSSIGNNKQLNDNSELGKINRINKINKKLNLIEEEAINQNQIQLIDALEQDTFSPHQTVTINWSSDTKTTTKLSDDKVNENRLKYSTEPDLKEENKFDSLNNVNIKDIKSIKDDNLHDYLHTSLHRLDADEVELDDEENKPNLHFTIPGESIDKFDLPNKGFKFNVKKSRQKAWNKRDPKLMDNSNLKQTTSSLPYSTLSSSHSSSHSSTSKTTISDLKQTLSNLLNKNKDTTKYTINTYSSVSYNPPHHHLQYKQINIKQPNNQTTLNTILPFTYSLADRLMTTTTLNENDDKLTKFLSLINKEEDELNDVKLNKEDDDFKLDDKRDDLFTTPISIDNLDNSFDKSTSLHALISRTSRHTNQNDQLVHHQLLSSLNLNSRSLLDSRGQNKAKNQVELRFNNTETIKINWPVKKAVDLAGDISLGGLMMIHERDENYTCGQIMAQGGIQALECMLYTIDWINNQSDFLTGIKLGAFILDDCDRDTYGLEQSIDFIKGSISNINDENYQCKDGSSPVIKQNPIAGVLGAASSMTSIQVANLLRLFRIPQISFFSTSPELSNKDRFEYFLRTVPSDTNQVKAMVEIVRKLNWTYVSVIYEESNYGDKAFAVLEIEFAKHHICIAVKEKLTKDSGVANFQYYEKLVRRLRTKPARGVIIFASDQEVAGVMDAVKHLGYFNHFQWIGSDGWSSRAVVTKNKERVVEGTLSLQPRANNVAGFENYFRSLRPGTNSRNPWFEEYWESTFHCKFLNSQVTPNNVVYMNGYKPLEDQNPGNLKSGQTRKSKVCTGEEQYSSEHPYEPERQLQFVSDAVLAFAYAFKAMHSKMCKGVPGLCDAMRPIDGTDLLKYLKTVEFTNLSNDSFKFTDTQDGPIRYNILLFTQLNETGKYDWVPVGAYEDEKLDLDFEMVKKSYLRRSSEQSLSTSSPPIFPDDLQSILPKSVCSLPCSKGQAKKFIHGEQCCWHCFNCSAFEIIRDESDCIECPNGELPDENQLNCIPIKEEYVSYNETLALIAMGIATFGIILTILVSFLFYKHRDTPVVKATGRELSSVLLGGILLCFGVTYILPLRPSVFSCALQRFLIGICFTIVYSALLTKTNRISRIFKASKKSAKRPNFIQPKSQLIICGCLISVQLIVYLLWIAFQNPVAIHHYPARTDNQLICASRINFTFLFVFLYPILLVIICTYYAFVTRKIPEGFNESKFIGFCMYSTIVIWLAFLPIFSVIKENVLLNMFTISCCISGSALTTLVLLFMPKCYIIILHPEKNVRQNMKPFSSTGNLKRSQPNSTSQMSSQIALPPASTTIQAPQSNNPNLNGHLTLHPNATTNGLKFTSEMTSSSGTATDFHDEYAELKKKSASNLSICGEKEMILKNRSHVATQTSLDLEVRIVEKNLDDGQSYNSNQSNTSGHSNFENNNNIDDQEDLNKELDISEIEIIDKESEKED